MLPSLPGEDLLNDVLRECALNLLVDKSKSVELRRIMWTSYANLRMWFDSWFRDIEFLDFADQDSKSELCISK